MLSNVLSKIIYPDVQLPLNKIKNGSAQLVVEEKDSLSKIKKLTITDINPDSFAFTLDHDTDKNNKKYPCFKQLSPYLHPQNGIGINKACDLVLFTEFKEKFYILIMEIKSDKPNIEKMKLQLKNSELYIEYILSLIKTFYPEELIPQFNYIRRYTTTKIYNNFTTRNRNKNFQKENYRVFVQVDNYKKSSIHIGKLLGL